MLIVSGRGKALTLLCGYCRKELTEPEMYAFRGWVACEQCIRDYYRSRPEQEVQSQLRVRQRDARLWVARNRKKLER